MNFGHLRLEGEEAGGGVRGGGLFSANEPTYSICPIHMTFETDVTPFFREYFSDFSEKTKVNFWGNLLQTAK